MPATIPLRFFFLHRLPAEARLMYFHDSTVHLNSNIVVRCKRSDKAVPSGTNRLPDQALLIVCVLCSEKRQYLPIQVYQGKPDYVVMKLARADVGEVNRRESYEQTRSREQQDRQAQEQAKLDERFTGALAVAASLVAALRLIKERDFSPSPRVIYAVSDAVSLARMVLKRVIDSR